MPIQRAQPAKPAFPPPLRSPRDNRARMRLFFLCLVPALLGAETWVKFVSGPIEVYSEAGERPARETMVRFQQFRHSLGQIVGEPDLTTPQPIRIVIFKNAKGWTGSTPIV